MPEPRQRQLTDDIHALLDALPVEIRRSVDRIPSDKDVIEVVMDLGRRPEARFGGGGEEFLLDREIDENDIQYVVDHIGSFGDDNRAGIERTLHRISAIRNRSGKIVGLTCRIGRAVFGTIEIIDDLVESGRSVLIMGRPGVGKTTMLREAARVLADDLDKRVVIVDTSNEIAGDGDIPHPGIGRARRMQVATPNLQHAVMIEAVENHMPEVVVIDEIGTELEAAAARTIAERGVQLIGTAHGNSLENLMLNPTLSDLIGGIQTVTLGDEEARRRRTQKSVLERKAPPTFDVIVEIQDRERVMVHADVAETVDGLLRGDAIAPELRWRDEGGVHKTQQRLRPGPNTQLPGERFQGQVSSAGAWREPGWRPDLAGRYDASPADDRGRGAYRPGASGGWRTPRRGGGRAGGIRSSRDARGAEPAGGPYGLAGDPYRDPTGLPFQAGTLADRGPMEREAPAMPGPSARDVRELTRQREWRESAARAMTGSDPALAAASPVTAGVPSIAPGHGVGASSRAAGLPVGDATSVAARERAERDADARRALPAELLTMADVDDAWLSPGPEDTDAREARDLEADDVEAAEGGADDARATAYLHDEEDEEDEEDDDEDPEDDDREVIAVRPLAPPSESLPTIRVLPFAISRKKLETAVRELQLPVAVVREIENADIVMTLRSAYRQKAPALREAEDRAIPIYVLKSNTTSQMEASLVSLYSLEVDPREAAFRETEEAIGIVLREAKAVELSPQNAYIRRMQHQMAERANLVSRSRGREPYRRVRVYPDPVRVWR